MLPSFSRWAPLVCGSASSDGSESPLLLVLHLEPPLEPKWWKEGWEQFKKTNQYTPDESVSHGGAWEEALCKRREAAVLTWLGLWVRSCSSSADSWSGPWGRCPLAAVRGTTKSTWDTFWHPEPNYKISIKTQRLKVLVWDIMAGDGHFPHEIWMTHVGKIGSLQYYRRG